MAHNLAAGVRAFTSNAFLLPGERTVLVDAGANFDAASAIRERTGDLDAVVLTHTHRDHVGNLESVKDAFGVDAWGFDTGQKGVDHDIADEETVQLGDEEYLALHTPGHKNDHLAFYSTGASTLFVGDLVFKNGSFGRTDLEEGDHSLLLDSIERLLDRVDPDLETMHTGHGPSADGDAYRHLELARQFAASRT
jgi:glyoxylase-like metal-dependent hydrolase (beta-lactamase superfamily II)